MATKNQTAQDTTMVTRLAGIADAMRRCRDDLQPHISEYENHEDGGHEASVVSQVATLIHVAWESVDYVLDTLEDGQSEVAQSQPESTQGTAIVRPLDAIGGEIWTCWRQLSEYNKRFDDRVDGLGETRTWYYLQRAENLLDVAEDRIDHVIWSLSAEGQQAHAEHSQQ